MQAPLVQGSQCVVKVAFCSPSPYLSSFPRGLPRPVPGSQWACGAGSCRLRSPRLLTSQHPPAGLRGSSRWPAGPCSSLILSLSSSAAGAVTWPGTGSSGSPPSPDTGPEDAHGAGLRGTTPDLLGHPIHAVSRADLLPACLSGVQHGRSEVRGGKGL